MKTESQEKQILNHLQLGKTINPIQALNLYGCFRLAAIIHTIRKDHEVKMEMSGGKKSFAVYSLLKED